MENNNKGQGVANNHKFIALMKNLTKYKSLVIVVCCWKILVIRIRFTNV